MAAQRHQKTLVGQTNRSKKRHLTARGNLVAKTARSRLVFVLPVHLATTDCTRTVEVIVHLQDSPVSPRSQITKSKTRQQRTNRPKTRQQRTNRPKKRHLTVRGKPAVKMARSRLVFVLLAHLATMANSKTAVATVYSLDNLVSLSKTRAPKRWHLNPNLSLSLSSKNNNQTGHGNNVVKMA
tara:strand:- start:542 stop:1087 length:546 start_codon:yes stop_codon:yes gene_type:complete